MTDIEEHDLGLSHDLPVLLSRRRALGLLAGGLGATALAACGSSSDGGQATTATEESATAEVPEETAGPYPGDGSNGPIVLAESGWCEATSRRASAERPERQKGCLRRSR